MNHEPHLQELDTVDREGKSEQVVSDPVLFHKVPTSDENAKRHCQYVWIYKQMGYPAGKQVKPERQS